MRKIKVWDKVEKTMYPFECITSINLYENYVELGEEEQGEYTEALWDKSLDLSDCKLIECTGLKDKNGNEIYEGDIIRNPQQELTKVVFNGGCFKRASINHPNANLYLLDSYHIWVEVIGNIYENPELAN